VQLVGEELAQRCHITQIQILQTNLFERILRLRIEPGALIILLVIKQMFRLFRQNQIQVGRIVLAVEFSQFELFLSQIDAPDLPSLSHSQELNDHTTCVAAEVARLRVQPDANRATAYTSRVELLVED